MASLQDIPTALLIKPHKGNFLAWLNAIPADFPTKRALMSKFSHYSNLHFDQAHWQEIKKNSLSPGKPNAV